RHRPDANPVEVFGWLRKVPRKYDGSCKPPSPCLPSPRNAPPNASLNLRRPVRFAFPSRPSLPTAPIFCANFLLLSPPHLRSLPRSSGQSSDVPPASNQFSPAALHNKSARSHGLPAI